MYTIKISFNFLSLIFFFKVHIIITTGILILSYYYLDKYFLYYSLTISRLILSKIRYKGIYLVYLYNNILNNQNQFFTN